jgi:hypothetical protein
LGIKAIGGGTVIFRTPQVHMLGSRDGLAMLWDTRVHPDHRCSGIGTTLFAEAEIDLLRATPLTCPPKIGLVSVLELGPRKGDY